MTAVTGSPVEDFILKTRGINPTAKKAYQALFNNEQRRDTSKKVLDDLMLRFKFYGAKPTTDPIQLAKNAAYREVIEYILTMSSRIADDTLKEVENFINK